MVLNITPRVFLLILADEFSRETVHKQRSEFLQWGLMADWSNPYITSDPEFIQQELGLFQQLYDKVSASLRVTRGVWVLSSIYFVYINCVKGFYCQPIVMNIYAECWPW